MDLKSSTVTHAWVKRTFVLIIITVFRNCEFNLSLFYHKIDRFILGIWSTAALIALLALVAPMMMMMMMIPAMMTNDISTTTVTTATTATTTTMMMWVDYTSNNVRHILEKSGNFNICFESFRNIFFFAETSMLLYYIVTFFSIPHINFIAIYSFRM